MWQRRSRDLLHSVCVKARGQFGSLFLPSITWVLGMELRWSGLVAETCTYWAILVTLESLTPIINNERNNSIEFHSSIKFICLLFFNIFFHRKDRLFLYFSSPPSPSLFPLFLPPSISLFPQAWPQTWNCLAWPSQVQGFALPNWLDHSVWS